MSPLLLLTTILTLLTMGNTMPTGTALVSSPLGSVEVVNRCPFDVHSNIVHGPKPGQEKPEEVFGVLRAFGGASASASAVSRSDAGRGPPVHAPPMHAPVLAGVVNGTAVNGTAVGNVTVSMSERGHWDVTGGADVISHPYLHDPHVGVSWKLYRGEGYGPVQIEWTWEPEQKRTFWDLSMINAASPEKRSLINREAPTPRQSSGGFDLIDHAFSDHGMSLIPVVNGQPVEEGQGLGFCTPIICPKGLRGCQTAYNAWNDWSAQRDCAEGVTLRVVLC